MAESMRLDADVDLPARRDVDGDRGEDFFFRSMRIHSSTVPRSEQGF
jgi:hypothetical protein